MDDKRNWMEIWAWILVTTGIIAIVVFGIRLSSEYTLSPNADLVLTETAQVGDFIGGFIGALWSLAGVLLFYSALRLQRKEFNLQRNELEDHRQEFTIGRITSVIYKQLELLLSKENDLSYFRHYQGRTGDFLSGLKAMQVFSIHAEQMSLQTERVFDRYTSNVYLQVIEYIDSQQFHNHMTLLKTTIKLVFNLVEKKKTKNSNFSLQKIVLDSSQQLHLYQLLKVNLDYLELDEYFTDIKKFLNHRRTMMLEGLSEIDEEQIGSYRQQIKDTEKHLVKINEVDELYQQLKQKSLSV